MKIRIGTLRRVIREALREQTWMPGRYYPGAEPMSAEDADRINSRLGEEDELPDLDEVDTDPSNNPGRPDDAYDYLGMHPKPTAAMAPPHAGGGQTSGASGGVGAPSGGVGAGTEDAPEPDEDA